jgi:hypothetical protein
MVMRKRAKAINSIDKPADKMNTSKNKYLLDAEGITLKPLPKQAREISAFFSLVIDETMEKLSDTFASTGIRCFKRGCEGIISSKMNFERNEIHWKCSKCVNNGTITGIL